MLFSKFKNSREVCKKWLGDKLTQSAKSNAPEQNFKVNFQVGQPVNKGKKMGGIDVKVTTIQTTRP